MESLHDKKILLAVTGSIAAYKSAFLVRNLIKQGCDVRVIMTNAACSFVSPLTFSTLSKNEVYSSVSSGESWNNHVEMGLWADAMVVAPCTATTLAKLAHGIADNVVVATYLSAKCPVFIAPAMDLDMWTHESTVDNISKVESYGNEIIPVGHGELASGLVGDGRMAEPIDICRHLAEAIDKKKDLINKKVLITAGPTIEHIDPIRFIGNHSSGKMGTALARECSLRGADVTLILGPTSIIPPTQIDVVKVETSAQMYTETATRFKDADITIFAAAVSDYRPETVANEKIKKDSPSITLELVKNVDIAYQLGKQKVAGQINVGFALETQNEEEYAQRKLDKKNFDMIVLNSLRDKGAGFGHDTNKISIIKKDNKITEYQLKSKQEVSKDIVNEIVSIISEEK